MAHGRQSFALVGYSEELENRPLKFVDPIPSSRICSACGNIPRMTHTLMCGHAFCDYCWESCTTTSECVCPLDGDVCGRDDVARIEYPAEPLLRRMVHCWNKANGCCVVLPALEVADHVRHDCQHHVTTCPKCLAAVLSRDVCAHLKSRCKELVLHAALEAPQGSANENTPFLTFEREVKERVRVLDTRLAQLSLENGSQSDKIFQLFHSVNQLRETVKEQFEALITELKRASVQSVDCLNRNEAEMKAFAAHEKTTQQQVGDLDAKLAQLSLKSDTLSDKLVDKIAEIKATEKNESLMTTITSAFAPVPSVPNTHQRILTGYAALKEKALKDGWSWSMSDKVYVRRYLMSWGIHFHKEDDSVYVSLCIQLHEGGEDDFLDWPFTKECRLSIIHPDTRQERRVSGSGNSLEANKKLYSRPIKTSNQAARFSETRIISSDLERDGYVKENELLLRFEVLP